MSQYKNSVANFTFIVMVQLSTNNSNNINQNNLFGFNHNELNLMQVKKTFPSRLTKFKPITFNSNTQN